ncbi:AAA family ATPase [Streptomyces sp. NPDC048514]|uniref:helix-turn-helix transcriptional regulator n=1 Tax=Streptomyces sp. NPDC048514 TaxID=3365564 RepID=UPI003724C318
MSGTDDGERAARRPWPLLDRDREFAEANRALQDPRYTGVLVTGPFGTGRSRLARECWQEAGRRGHPLLRVSATPAASSVPLGALAPVLRRAPDGTHRLVWGTPGGTEGAYTPVDASRRPAVDGNGLYVPRRPAEGGHGPPDGPHRPAEGGHGSAAGPHRPAEGHDGPADGSHHPLDGARARPHAERDTRRPRPVLFLDDAHHLDDASARMLAALMSSGRVSVVATTDPDTSLPWRDHARVPLFAVQLRTLSLPVFERLLRCALGGPVERRTVRLLFQAVGGRPRELEEILDDALSRGVLVLERTMWRLAGPLTVTPRLRALVESQARRLHPAHVRYLERVAVCGRLVLDEERRPDAERLARAGWVRLVTDGPHTHVEPCGSLHREVLRASLPSQRIRRVLREEVEAARHRGPDPALLLDVVRRRLDAGEPLAPDDLERAVTLARHAPDHPTALRLARELLRLRSHPHAPDAPGSHPHPLLTVAEQLWETGRPQEADAALRRALADSTRPLDRAAAAVLRAHHLAFWELRGEEALSVLAEARHAYADRRHAPGTHAPGTHAPGTHAPAGHAHAEGPHADAGHVHAEGPHADAGHAHDDGPRPGAGHAHDDGPRPGAGHAHAARPHAQGTHAADAGHAQADRPRHAHAEGPHADAGHAHADRPLADGPATAILDAGEAALWSLLGDLHDARRPGATCAPTAAGTCPEPARAPQIHALVESGRTGEAADLARRTRTARPASGAVTLAHPALLIGAEAYALAESGALAAAGELAEHGYDLAVDAGSARTQVWLAANLGWIHYLRGRLDDSHVWYAGALTHARETGLRAGAWAAMCGLSLVAAVRADVGDAEHWLDRARALGSGGCRRAEADLAEVWLAASTGRIVEARDRLRRAVEDADGRGMRTTQSHLWCDIARLGGAGEAVAPLSRIAASSDSALVAARAEFARTTASGDPGAMETCAARLERLGAELLAAEAWNAAATARTRTRARYAVREHAAHEARRQVTRLTGPDAPARTFGLVAPEARCVLTGRELQVALAVASGLPREETARRLSLADRTVVNHLQSVRSKLGVRDIGGIRSALHPLGARGVPGDPLGGAGG